MIFRRADERDVKRIMEMIHQAQEDLKSTNGRKDIQTRRLCGRISGGEKIL